MAVSSRMMAIYQLFYSIKFPIPCLFGWPRRTYAYYPPFCSTRQSTWAGRSIRLSIPSFDKQPCMSFFTSLSQHVLRAETMGHQINLSLSMANVVGVLIMEEAEQYISSFSDPLCATSSHLPHSLQLIDLRLNLSTCLPRLFPLLCLQALPPLLALSQSRSPVQTSMLSTLQSQTLGARPFKSSRATLCSVSTLPRTCW